MKKINLKFLGLAGEITKGKVGKWHFSGKNFDTQLNDTEFYKPLPKSRFQFFYAAVFLIVAGFITRLIILTIVDGEKNLTLAESNRIRIQEVGAPRGIIYDQYGQALATSRSVFILQKGQNETKIDEAQVAELQKQGLASEYFEGELGRIYTQIKRSYPHKEATAHVLGYTSIATNEDIEKNSQTSSVSWVGRAGIEAAYDNFLQGEPGKKLIEVDASGAKVAILGQEEAKKGRDLHLTIDSALQQISYDALFEQTQKTSKKGAMVIQNPKSGEVLSLVSIPSYDGEDIGKYVSDIEKPFLNRAIQGVYPPGSVFKIVSALAGLESGKVTKDTEIEDVGEFELGGQKFPNWFYLQYGKKDGILKIEKAIARSNDIFFYRLSEIIGLDALRNMATSFGFGQKTGIDIPGEAVGLVPDEVWKQSAYGENWFLGDTMHMGIGQGFILTTPVQISAVTSYVASGKLIKPYLVAKIGEGESGKEVTFGSKIVKENIASSENLAIVRNGMKSACQTGGTGWPFFDAPYTVACKTGTAERGLGNPHAWFTAYAPHDNPQIAITVLVEDGGEGSTVAGPVARKILDWWFENR